MKKVLSYILISLIISANLLAPISVGVESKKVTINKNIASAVDQVTINGNYTFIVKEFGTKATLEISTDINKWGAGYSIAEISYSLTEIKTDADGKKSYADQQYRITMEDKTADKNGIYTGSVAIEGLTVSTPYEYEFRVTKKNNINVSGIGTSSTNDKLEEPIKINFITSAQTTTEGQTVTTGSGNIVITPNDTSSATMPACIFGSPLKGTFGGCMAQALYYIVFVPSSYLFAMSGIFFDSSFAYSVQDSSYRSAFVVQGWGLIRDFCNMFFIFIMLYIAIGTILSLNSVKTKETIINVVIIGLFINFSLFATQIIIDASNITARVFYNSNSIKITEKGVTGATNVVSKIGEGGVIPISAALVNKINPQNLILNAGKINDVTDEGGSSALDQSEQKDFNSGNANFTAGTFALIVIMTSAVNIVGFTVFITVGFLFFARVIGLWLAMILAPLAFFTYILPEMSGIKMIGWKNWWPETLKMAFLAPVFIFFMYLILKFLEMDLISDAQGKSGVAFFVAGMIPFVFIMIFMIKAKKIAVDMSGEFGEMVTKAGSAVGGLALGAATGGTAMLMRGTIGRLGSSIANSDSIQQAAAKKGLLGMGARMLFSGGKKAGSASFDARNTKAGAAAGSKMGVDMGKAKEGGFVKARAEKTAKRQQRAKDLELSVDSTQRKELMKKQMEQKRLEDEFSVPLHKIDGDLTAAKTRFAEAASGSDEQKAESAIIRELNAKKAAYTKGGASRDAAGNLTGGYNTNNGNISATAVAVAADNLTKANNSMVAALAAQTAANNAATNTTNQVTNTRNALTTAENEMLTTQNTATVAAAAAAADPNNVALAISNTNALAALAASTNKVDKAKAAVTTAETAETNSRTTITTATDRVDAARTELNNANTENNNATTAAAAATAPGGKGLGRSINDLKFTDIPHDELAINKRNNRVKGEFAEYLGSGANQVANFLSSGGVHDFDGDFEAMYKIKMDAKIENSGGGGSHSAPAHAPATPAVHATPATPAAATHP